MGGGHIDCKSDAQPHAHMSYCQKPSKGVIQRFTCNALVAYFNMQLPRVPTIPVTITNSGFFRALWGSAWNVGLSCFCCQDTNELGAWHASFSSRPSRLISSLHESCMTKKAPLIRLGTSFDNANESCSIEIPILLAKPPSEHVRMLAADHAIHQKFSTASQDRAVHCGLYMPQFELFVFFSPNGTHETR